MCLLAAFLARMKILLYCNLHLCMALDTLTTFFVSIQSRRLFGGRDCIRLRIAVASMYHMS